MFERAIQFLKDHNEIALATCEGNLPKLRIFQIMKQEGHVLYFATSRNRGTDTVLKTKLFGLKVRHFNNSCLLIAFTRSIHALFSL